MLKPTSNLNDYRLYHATRGTSPLATVSTTLKIIGSGNVTTPGYQCSSNCALQGALSSTVVLQTSAQAIWSASCAANGRNPNHDGTLVFTKDGVCTVTFPSGNPEPQGGGCASPSGRRSCCRFLPETGPAPESWGHPRSSPYKTRLAPTTADDFRRTWPIEAFASVMVQAVSGISAEPQYARAQAEARCVGASLGAPGS
jgi:hypothetical protein